MLLCFNILLLQNITNVFSKPTLQKHQNDVLRDNINMNHSPKWKQNHFRNAVYITGGSSFRNGVKHDPV